MSVVQIRKIRGIEKALLLFHSTAGQLKAEEKEFEMSYNFEALISLSLSLHIQGLSLSRPDRGLSRSVPGSKGHRQ